MRRGKPRKLVLTSTCCGSSPSHPSAKPKSIGSRPAPRPADSLPSPQGCYHPRGDFEAPGSSLSTTFPPVRLWHLEWCRPPLSSAAARSLAIARTSLGRLTITKQNGPRRQNFAMRSQRLRSCPPRCGQRRGVLLPEAALRAWILAAMGPSATGWRISHGETPIWSCRVPLRSVFSAPSVCW